MSERSSARPRASTVSTAARSTTPTSAPACQGGVHTPVRGCRVKTQALENTLTVFETMPPEYAVAGSASLLAATLTHANVPVPLEDSCGASK